MRERVPEIEREGAITFYGQALYPYWRSRKGAPLSKIEKVNFAYAFLNKK